jgi:hypothetical protein
VFPHFIFPEKKIFIFFLDHQTKSMLQRRIMDAFDDFSKDWLKSCSQLEEASNIPVSVIEIKVLKITFKQKI